MPSPVIKKSIRHYEGVIDGSETVTASIPCLFMGPVQIIAQDNGAASGFGGGTLSVEHLPDGETTWIPWSTIAITADGADTCYPPAAGVIRLKLTDATTPSINWSIRRGVGECG